MLLAGSAFFALPSSSMVIGWMVVVCSVSGGMVLLSRSSGRTRLRRGRWGSPEMIISAGSFVAVIGLLLTDPTVRSYDPYRLMALGFPRFDPVLGITLLGLALPGLFSHRNVQKAQEFPDDHT
jgi:hypothetical protein